MSFEEASRLEAQFLSTHASVGPNDDDAPVLQAKIDDLVKNGGGTLQLENRVYWLGKALKVAAASKVRIHGAGQTATILMTLLSNKDGHIILEHSQYCSVSNLVFIGAPRGAAAVSVVKSFWTELTEVHFPRNWMALFVEASNTVTLADSIITNVLGPAGISVGAPVGDRVDIFQATRVTTNQVESTGVNTSVIWLHIGQGVNTVRLDNFGLINGGNGIRMDANWPVGHTTTGGQDPLFLFAQDLEIDFPGNSCIDLQRGRVANCVNCYIQGSKSGHGIYVGKNWTAELQVSNTRISGNAQAGVKLDGGRHSMLVGNIIADNSQSGSGFFSGVEIAGTEGCDGCVQNVVVNGNRIGAIQTDLPSAHDSEEIKSSTACNQAWGVNVLSGAKQVVISSNLLGGNVNGGVHDSDGLAVVGLNMGGDGKRAEVI